MSWLKNKISSKKENDNNLSVNVSNDNYSIGLQIGKILNILDSINNKLDKDLKKIISLEKRIKNLERVLYGK